MNAIGTKPYKVLWISIPIVLGISLLGFNNKLDIQLHDTYFVIASTHLGLLFSIILGLNGFLYWILKKKLLVSWMVKIHVGFTVSIFILMAITGAGFNKLVGANADLFRTINQFLIILILLAIISQLLFLLNLIISSIKRPT